MNKLHSRFLALTALMVLVACAKEKKYDAIYKDSVYTKSAISTDPNDPYVYVPSVGETPMSVTASRSYWMGEQKLATFKFEEGELIAVQLPDDARFAANTSNQSPILRIKVDHKDYRCAEDQFGECGNKEEEIDNRHWKEKRFFKADFSSMKLAETNTLPEQLASAFSKCYGESTVVVKDVKIEQDAVNIHVQKTWEANIMCADFENITSFTDLLRDMSFTVNYYYSFVKLSKLANKDYKAFNYPFADQNTFGYFTTDMTKLSSDGRNTMESKSTFMNRWDPAAKELVYHLNDGFYAEGMDAIRLATEQGVETINNSFAKAGIDKKITLKDGRGLSIGDLRYNFLILVSDPQASGVIGYGPTVANPRTGEILKGQTVMYYGSMKRVIEETYDELVAEKQRELAIRNSSSAGVKVDAPAAGAAINAEASERLESHRALMNNYSAARPTTDVRVAIARSNNVAGARVSTNFSKEKFSTTRRVELSTWLEKLRNPNTDERTRAKATMEEMSHQCFYHESMVNWHDSLADSISTEELGIDELKPWIELSDEEHAKIIAKLMPTVWVPTLVHELGHNLGLRHNFSGSEDKANYYSASERSALGIARDVTYSSVMDYSYSNLNQLPVMGKYDLAALKFGYKREVELNDGSSVVLPEAMTFEKLKAAKADSAEGQLNAKIRDFQYCTDEHVEVNAGCNRFDDGAGLEAIAQHYVMVYNKRIAKRNYRNNRARFSIVNDRSYYYGVEYTFEGLRRFFEMYDRFSVDYAQLFAMTAAQWDAAIAAAPEAQRAVIIQNRDFFLGVKKAAQIAADFYMDVLTTPDVHCALIKKGTNQIAAIEPLSVFSPDGEAVNCFDSENVGVNPEYEVVAETGRFFNHQRQKSLLPGQLSASADELSVRGMWMDKILAVKWLTYRELDNTVFDEYRSNFMDYPEFGDKIRSTLVSYLTDGLEVESELRFADGSTLKVPNVYSIGNTHTIKTVVLTPFHNRIGVKRVQTDFREIMLPIIKDSLRKADDLTKTLGLLNSLSLVAVNPTTTLDQSQVAATAEFRDAAGQLIGRYAATKDQQLGVELMGQRALRVKLATFKRDDVVKVYLAMQNNQIPTEIPENLKPLFEMKKDDLFAFLTGALPADDLLIRMFNIMAI